MACGDISRLPDGVIGVAGDLFNEDCPATWPIGAVDYLVYCAAATDHDEAGYRAAYVQGLQHVLGWLDDYGQVPERCCSFPAAVFMGSRRASGLTRLRQRWRRLFRRVMLEAEQLPEQRHPGQYCAPDRYLRPGP
jgi:hypothetical protein